MLASAAGLLAFSLFSASRAVPGLRHNLVVRSELSTIPSGFRLHDFAALPDELVHLTLAIPQVNVSGLHAALLDVSHPQSANYGRHLSKQEVEQLVAPRPESLRAVTDWLTSQGVSPVAAFTAGDILNVQLPIERANTLLGARFTKFIHEDTNTTVLRTLSYSLPDYLHDHIRFVYPTTHFLPPVKRRVPIANADPLKRKRGVPSSCAETTTPRCLQEMYNIPSAPSTVTNNSLYVSGLGVGEHASQDDLQDFLAKLRPDAPGTTFDVLPINGRTPAPGPGTAEANFDIQYTVGLATNVPTTFVTTAQKSSAIILQDLLDTVTFLLEQDDVPLVLTTSYTFSEDDVGDDYARSICDMYAQLGARGTSVIFASGDSGVAGGFLNDPADCEGKPFVPTFPSTCPFVTSVGATQDMNPAVAAPFSSGGFSNVFPRPSYQSDAVEKYLRTLGNTYNGRYNASGRAYPDVSVHGVNYMYNLAGDFSSAYGTSTSAPVFASIIALLNDRLLSAGKRPMGFLNPFLYSTGAAAFDDVTSGSNPGCWTDGFQAANGWDPVTGLGTPDFDRLVDALVAGGDETAPVSNRNSQNAARGTWTVFLLMPIYAVLWTGLMFMMDLYL
ncbi:peptidase S8/S53 domain-containing protein [Fomes fomentarius]|nr:peptidase S8/S53 domain-containing protein [Fomes fomentarius]